MVKTTKNSSMSLETDNSLFGNVDQVPSEGKVTTSNGKCKSAHGGCPSASKSVSGYGFIADNSYVGWAGVKCGKDKRHRSSYRGGNQGGDLTWTPSGMGPVSVDQDFETEYGTLSKMQVANR